MLVFGASCFWVHQHIQPFDQFNKWSCSVFSFNHMFSLVFPKHFGCCWFSLREKVIACTIRVTYVILAILMIIFVSVTNFCELHRNWSEWHSHIGILVSRLNFSFISFLRTTRWSSFLRNEHCIRPICFYIVFVWKLLRLPINVEKPKLYINLSLWLNDL